MNNDNNYTDGNNGNNLEAPVNKTSSLNNMNALSQYLKSTAATREGRAIPPLDKWHPENIADMDLVIKANGEWWHEGGKMTRQSLVNLFATILWKEENDGVTEYFLKTPVQKIRIQVDVVRLDDEHPISLQAYQPDNAADRIDESQVRPYMPVRNGLNALIGRNTFYHLTEIGELTEHDGKTMLTLQSGGKSYSITMPDR